MLAKPSPAPVLWLTGLSGAGKSTLALATQHALTAQGLHAFVLDGDILRKGLCSDLGFSPQDRSENIRRIAEAAKLLSQAGVISIVAVISPMAADRAKARKCIGERFIEIYCNAPLTTCENRDVKGLYQQARSGKIDLFTGISSPYDIPESPEITCPTALKTVEDCTKLILDYLSTPVRTQILAK